ncbi:hypothetical protein [Thiocystis violacea]|nr:hypothetical protein [Thiocystis violacea]
MFLEPGEQVAHELTLFVEPVTHEDALQADHHRQHPVSRALARKAAR